MSPTRRLIYASLGVTTHDVRFLKTASSIFQSVLYLRFDGKGQSVCPPGIPQNVAFADWFGSRHSIATVDPAEFLEPFNEVVDGFRPKLIHAGPLSSVAWVASADSTVPVLGMSWATDVLVDAQTPSGASRVSETCQQIAALITDSQTTAALARDFGFAGRDLAVFPWGVDLDSFAFSTLPSTSSLAFVSLRSHEHIYDIPTIIKGFARARTSAGTEDLSLTIVGKGTTTAECIQLASECGLGKSIQWQDPYSESELPAVLNRYHGSISAARSDGSSVSMLQTMACGRIAIVANLPSNLEWIDDGFNGFTFELGSSESLGETLNRVNSFGAKLGEVARNARQTVEQRADWRVNRQILANLYLAFLQHTL